MCCLTPSDQEGRGCPLLRPRPPHASACRGERPYWWEQAQGLNSPRRRAPLVRQDSDIGRAEKRKSVLASVSRPDRDGLTAPTPRSPSTSAEGAWRNYSSSVNFAGISRRGPVFA